jgi:hypothetical protein
MRGIVAGALVLSLAAGGVAYGTGRGRECGKDGSFRELEAIGLTDDQRLICFEEDDPGRARDIGQVTGPLGDEQLVGIDFRPSTGELYGLGNLGGVFVLDPETAAVLVKKSTLSVAPIGTSFGVDFNPVPDRLRVVSNTGQNLRANVDDGVTANDGAINIPPAPAVITGVTGVAYLNNDKDVATGTLLFDVETETDRISAQVPANAGALNLIGPLGVDTGVDVGFDVYTAVQGDSARRNKALAALDVDGRSRLYEVDVLTGRTTLRGAFARRNHLIGLAIPLVQGKGF